MRSSEESVSMEDILSLHISDLRLRNISFQGRDSRVGLFSIKTTYALEWKVLFAWTTEDRKKS